MFWGSRTVADKLDSGKIRDLDNSQEAQSGVFSINQKPQGAYQFVVAIPKASNLTLISAKNATSMDDETINKFEMSQLPVNGENSYATIIKNNPSELLITQDDKSNSDTYKSQMKISFSRALFRGICSMNFIPMPI